MIDSIYLEIGLMVYFSINSFLMGYKYADDRYDLHWFDWLIITLGIFLAIPIIVVMFLYYFLIWCLEKLNVFFYYNLWFTDKFKDTPEELLAEDNRYTRAIKKKYPKVT